MTQVARQRRGTMFPMPPLILHAAVPAARASKSTKQKGHMVNKSTEILHPTFRYDSVDNSATETSCMKMLYAAILSCRVHLLQHCLKLAALLDWRERRASLKNPLEVFNPGPDGMPQLPDMALTSVDNAPSACHRHARSKPTSRMLHGCNLLNRPRRSCWQITRVLRAISTLRLLGWKESSECQVQRFVQQLAFAVSAHRTEPPRCTHCTHALAEV